MVGRCYIELCNSRWFDAGNDARPDDYAIRMMYVAKQAIRQALLKIGCKDSMSELEKALKDVPADKNVFDGHPYLTDDKIYISSPSMSSDCCLGRIVK